MESDNVALRDVRAYGPRWLAVDEAGVRIPVTYHREWQDGFGARGWKLDVTLEDEEIIASTPETGERIPTSVFVHDIFDHLLSGFAVSGHRAEAMALCQLGSRTGADVAPDYAQMVREDLRSGRLVGAGDSLRDFLGEDLLARVGHAGCDDRALVGRLRDALGEEGFEAALVARFFIHGRQGEAHARQSYAALGLDRECRAAMALALQRAFVELDRRIQELGVASAYGRVCIGYRACAIELDNGWSAHGEWQHAAC
ncbi:MAG TPA: hypothetical protein ENN42_10335 [Thioalkalivibrio sp.]|nr:hypothetical protein [Thioalkalivibrio sp.]